MQIEASITDRVTLHKTILNSSTNLPLDADDSADVVAEHIEAIMDDPEHAGATLRSGTRVVPTATGILISTGPSSFDIPWRYIEMALTSLRAG